MAQWKQSVGDVMDVAVQEDGVRISLASFAVKKDERMNICDVRDELVRVLGSITPGHQPEPFICNFHQFLGKQHKKCKYRLIFDASLLYLTVFLLFYSIMCITPTIRKPKVGCLDEYVSFLVHVNSSINL